MTKPLGAALGLSLAVIGFLGSRALDANTSALRELRSELAEFRKLVAEDRERLRALETWREIHSDRKVTADSLIAEPD